jgi:hypothetical protein
LFSFRATHDGGGFPLTGYPAMDVATWKRIIAICKTWGLNGMRFHSWCPPEAAFTAGDELGFYFQPECGMWNAFDNEGKMLAVLNDETARLLKAYGNHPSLVLLNATNEPAGTTADPASGLGQEMARRRPAPSLRRRHGPVPPWRIRAPGCRWWCRRGAPPPPPPPFVYTACYNVTGGRGPRLVRRRLRERNCSVFPSQPSAMR